MDENESEDRLNVITCVNWVKKGAANPKKVELCQEELERIIQETQQELEDIDVDSDNEDSSQDVKKKGNKEKKEESKDDEYNFDDYDETSQIPISMDGIVEFNNGGKDPFITITNSDDDDSEKEDDTIMPNDNLVLIGHVEGDASILQVFVYNDSEGSFYCHHDILLPAFPLCIEPLSYEQSTDKPGNLCAIGSMSPIIDVWDLDIIDCLEPAFRLGRKANHKKNITRVGHRDAVLDIAWNANFIHILASGSVDRTVLLWDMENGQQVTKFSSFEEKVQSIEWHPKESNYLLTGCADRIVRIFDGRSENQSKYWKCKGEVEKVLWNHYDPNVCFIGTENGYLECIDIRQDKILWKKVIHEKEITGLSLSSTCPGLLVSSSGDGVIKVWDILDHLQPELVLEKQANIGKMLCLAANPDVPFVFVAGGDQKSNYLRLFDFSKTSEVIEKFGQRELIKTISENEEIAVESNEMKD